MLLSFRGLSWEDLKARGEARDGGRNPRKGSFTHTSDAWAGRTGRLGLLTGVPTSNPSMGAAVSGLLAFSRGGSRLQAQANRADTAACVLIWLPLHSSQQSESGPTQTQTEGTETRLSAGGVSSHIAEKHRRQEMLCP